MADKIVDINGHQVRYDDSSDTLGRAIHHLKDKLGKEEAEVFFHTARHNDEHHKAHIEIPNHHESDRADNLTLVHEGDKKYHLRKRSYQ